MMPHDHRLRAAKFEQSYHVGANQQAVCLNPALHLCHHCAICRTASHPSGVLPGRPFPCWDGAPVAVGLSCGQEMVTWTLKAPCFQMMACQRKHHWAVPNAAWTWWKQNDCFL